MTMTPDATVLWQAGSVTLNATIVFTWAVMALMLALSWLISRRLTATTDLDIAVVISVACYLFEKIKNRLAVFPSPHKDRIITDKVTAKTNPQQMAVNPL